MPTTEDTPLVRICRAIAERQRFLITSHLKPDGDAIGCELAMASALRAMGKQVRVVNHDPAPDALAGFPGVADIEITDRVDDPGDAVLVMECGDLARTGLAGLEHAYLINIDHHKGNTAYGAVNWFDGTVSACGELIFEVITALGVPLTHEIALHIYVAILTDSGSFHHAGVSPRTFDICRQALEAGVDPVAVARTVFDSSSIGRIRMFGRVLSALEVDASGRLATLYLDHAIAEATGGAFEDTEGLINEPLSVREIQAVVFFKEAGTDQYRLSFRSKGRIDVGEVARAFGGGGHRNASGCTVSGALAEVRRLVLPRVVAAIAAGLDPVAPQGDSCP